MDKTMRKVLITGASGSLGALARTLFCNCAVTLSSRRQLSVGENEVWYESKDLNDSGWWGDFGFEGQFDLVLHFAEPVKARVTDGEISKIIASHIGFISSATASCGRVIYPLTAYCYDLRVSKSAITYLRIKEEVYAALKSNDRVLFPIFHPLVDYGDGLAKLIHTERKIPFVNLFSEFDARLPVLTKMDIEKFLVDGHQEHAGRIDVYSRISSVSELFARRARIDSRFVSRCVKALARVGAFVPAVHLLTNGRDIAIRTAGNLAAASYAPVANDRCSRRS